MHLGAGIKRGRPAGRLTTRRRQVLDYAMRCQANGEPLLIGPMVRVCKLVDRSSAKRILRELRELGMVQV